ncbi:MAG: ribbon-helix-helix protein, CopG family [Chloroflexi bacterium]|nr:ribbon-helix-helix protein, CopG family [Chloroflexota bacterium]
MHLEDDLVAALDAWSAREGRSRTNVIRAACWSFLRRREQERLDRIYVEGYQRIPEDATQGKALDTLAAEALPHEDW